ncbi:DUF4936 family protein [Aquabacterium sp.]|uniref:DUF4936 family protein n=1 Tax=Aquabacterium sp. TaxID=1872578 RepID=UPI0035C6FEB7
MYYRVSPAQMAGGVLDRVRALQAAVTAAHPGLHAELMARTDSAPGEDATWMEVYRHPEGVSVAVEDTLFQLLAAWPAPLVSVRHTESFAPVRATDSLD